jgi:serine protease Do
MGLKEGDIITKMDSKPITCPDDLTAAVKSHKPGDKVSVTYLREKKENTATAELGKWKSTNFKMDMGDMNWDNVMPKIQTMPRGNVFSTAPRTPKMGLSVQDTDDGKGVKVIEVDEESNAAKAGIKENDILTEIDGKVVNSTDEVVKSLKENKDKISVMFKLTRSGKTQNVEVKMPRAIKTKDL